MFVYRLNDQRRSAAGWDDMRAHNTGLLLRAIWYESGISRAELARRSMLSRATVSDIVGGLVDVGLVVEAAALAPSSGGRPPIRLEFQDNWRHLIGIELGASHVSGVRTDMRGQVLARFNVEGDVEGDPQSTLKTMDEGIRQLIDVDRSIEILGLGLGVPSPLRSTDVGHLAPHLFPRWAHIDLVAYLKENHALTVLIDNDANLGALAEHWWGAGKDVSDLAYIKLATGVGAGILIAGEIHRGATGIAGEIGHTAIDPMGPRCRCGLKGCLEAFVGTSSLMQQAQDRFFGTGRCPDWALPTSTIHDLIVQAHAGQPIAKELVHSAGTWLGIAIANLLNLVNPGRVILGGRLTEAGDLLMEPLLMAIQQRALWTSVAGSSIVISALGNDAVALGAATLVLQDALTNPSHLLNQDRRISSISSLTSTTHRFFS